MAWWSTTPCTARTTWRRKPGRTLTSLLAKVTVFGPQKERSRKEQEKKDELEKKKKDWEKMQDEKKKVEGGIGTDEDKQMQKDLTLEDLIKFVTTNEDPEESEV